MKKIDTLTPPQPSPKREGAGHGLRKALHTILTTAAILPSLFGEGPGVGLKAQMVVDTFFFTGAQQTFIVPSDVNSIFVDVRGAQGEKSDLF